MTKTNNEEWGLMIFKSTFDYLIEGDLSNDGFCELMRCIYNLRENGEMPDMSAMSKEVRLVWRNYQHTILKSIRNARYYEKKKNGGVYIENNETAVTDAPNNAECEKYIKVMRNIIEKAKSSTYDEFDSLRKEFETASDEAEKYATEKQKQTLIPAIKKQFEKAVDVCECNEQLPEWMAKQLPKPTYGNARYDAVRYIQQCEQLLANEQTNKQYAEKVPLHRDLMYCKLCNDYGKYIQSELKETGKDMTIDDVSGCLYEIWQKYCKFKLKGYEEWKKLKDERFKKAYDGDKPTEGDLIFQEHNQI